MAQRFGRDSRREIGDERESEHFHARLAGRDGLERRRHADDVAAQGFGHLHFGGRLVVRPAKLHVDALVELGRHGVCQIAQPLRIQVGQVDKRGAFERRVCGEVEVIADQHGCSGHPVVFDSPRTIGENHDGCPRRRRGAHRVRHPPHAVVLVVVGAGADNESALATRQQDRSQRAHVPLECGLTEASDIGGGDGVCGLADEVGGFRPAGAERQGDVVALDTRGDGQLGGGLSRDSEGVGVRVVERVHSGVAHDRQLSEQVGRGHPRPGARHRRRPFSSADRIGV